MALVVCRSRKVLVLQISVLQQLQASLDGRLDRRVALRAIRVCVPGDSALVCQCMKEWDALAIDATTTGLKFCIQDTATVCEALLGKSHVAAVFI
jgi:hypothetical protein